MTLIELIDIMYIESNKIITRKETGEIVEYKSLNDKQRHAWRYAKINQIQSRLELLFDLSGFVPDNPAEQLEQFQVKTTIPYEEARIQLILIHDKISAAYRIAKKKDKSIVFKQWAEDNSAKTDIYERVIEFRDYFYHKYEYDLINSGLITVSYDNDFLKSVSDWLETAAFIIFNDSNTLIRRYVHDGEIFEPRITQKMCNTLCRNDKTYWRWHNILMAILSMYNDTIRKIHASEYEYRLPLSKRLHDMTKADERFIRSVLTCITDHVEYKGKLIRVFEELKKGYWEYLPLLNRMELYNCIEALVENKTLYKYMLIDSDKDTAQRVLRLYNKLLEPEYYRICLKMDLMLNCIYGKQCQSRETAGEAIREYERQINEVYDYYLKNVELSTDQVQENLTAQLEATLSDKDKDMEQPNH